jgi:hypothetical protein
VTGKCPSLVFVTSDNLLFGPVAGVCLLVTVVVCACRWYLLTSDNHLFVPVTDKYFRNKKNILHF